MGQIPSSRSLEFEKMASPTAPGGPQGGRKIDFTHRQRALSSSVLDRVLR